MSPIAANATLVPSGEMTGWTMPTTLRGTVESKSRVRWVYCAFLTCTVAEKGTVCVAPPSARLRILPSET